MTVAEAVIAELRRAGVRALFGVPGGGGNLDLIDAAHRAQLPFVLTATETAGAMAAIAQAEVTGRPGACLTTIGPGATSVVNGVACARLERAPVIVITDAPADPRFAHQRVDQRAVLRPVTKWSATLSPSGSGALVVRAVAHALAAPAGPVHLQCPGDIARRDAARGARAGAVAPRRLARPPMPPLMQRLLARARKPLLLVGLGARKSEAARAIRAICGRGVPALVTYKARGVVADDDPMFAGMLTNGAVERGIIDESDLLIGVGLDPVELLPQPWPDGPPVLSCAETRMAVAHVPFRAQWVAPVGPSLRQIGAGLGRTDWEATAVRRHVARQRDLVRGPGPSLTAAAVVDRTARTFAPVAARVTVDAGAHMFPATTLWPVLEPNGLLISNGLSTMGFALPAAIGAALLDRARPVVAFTGDGGLLMCAGELLTAAREGLRIVTVVFADGSLSLIEIKQARRRLQPSGVAIGSVDWRGLAASVGVAADVATTGAELDRALVRARDRRGPSLIEARIDRSPYGAMLEALRG